MPRGPALEHESSSSRDLVVEVAAVIDHDRYGGTAVQRSAAVGEGLGDAVAVLGDRPAGGAAGGRAQLEAPPVGQPEQLVCVAVLLVVVDQAGVGRGCDDAVDAV